MSGDTKELRGEAPADLVRALDALAFSHGMTRHSYCLEILEKHVMAELKKVTVITRMMRGNPLLTAHARTEAGKALSYESESDGTT